MKKILCILFCLIPLNFVLAQDDLRSVVDGIKWIEGPATGDIGKIAQIKIPQGYAFAGAKDTIRLMEAMQNFTDDSMLGMIRPLDFSWFIIFEWSEIGYVPDDEKLDADALFSSMLENEKLANKERAKRGWQTMHLQRWFVKPNYNSETKNLEWGTLFKGGEEGESDTVNFNTRILGRRGVMSCTLVINPSQSGVIAPSRELLAGFSFKPGGRYEEFVQGDKVAEYGLAALVLGGGAALAAKMGILQKFWKLIVVGVVAAGAFVKKFFRKLSGKE